jgi:hypothetical protein
MPDVPDAVLLAATAWPGAHAADSLARGLALDPAEINSAIADPRCSGLVQKRRSRRGTEAGFGPATLTQQHAGFCCAPRSWTPDGHRVRQRRRKSVSKMTSTVISP